LLIDSTKHIKRADSQNDDDEEDSPYQNAPGELQMFNENGGDYYAGGADAEEEEEQD
jgi:hypothetical protein